VAEAARAEPGAATRAPGPLKRRPALAPGFDPATLIGRLQASSGNHAVNRLLDERRGAPGARVGAEGGPLDEEVASAIQAKQRTGNLLETSARASMEETFGTRLDDVQVHADREADELNRRLNAVAFTTGSDIFFSEGAYQPGAPAGDRLLAHEVTHVVQQRSAGPSSGPLTVGPAGDAHEQAADAAGTAEVDAAVGGGRVQRAPAPPPVDHEQLLEPARAAVEQALQADPEDRLGAVRQKLAQVPPNLREPIVGQLKPRFPKAGWLQELGSGGPAAGADGAAAEPGTTTAASGDELTGSTISDGTAPSMQADGAGPRSLSDPGQRGTLPSADGAAGAGAGLGPADAAAHRGAADLPSPEATVGSAVPPIQTGAPLDGTRAVVETGAVDAGRAQGLVAGGGVAEGSPAGTAAAGAGVGGATASGHAVTAHPAGAPAGQGPAGGHQAAGAAHGAGVGGAHRAGGGGSAASAQPGGPASAASTATAALGAAAPAAAVASASTANLALVDTELAEHQRWGAAAATVGAAGSEQRAEFVAEQLGGGLLAGFGQGAEMGLGLGLVEAFSPVPGVGAIIGGVQAIEGLNAGFAHAHEAVEAFGEGSDTYEVLANSIAAVSAIVEVVTSVMAVFNGVLGVIEVALWAITAGAAVAAIFTLGAAASIAVMAGEAAEVVTEIKEAVGLVMLALSGINSLILQPVVLLFRAMHTMTSQADPRAVVAQGGGLKQSAGAVGGFLGGLAGAELAGGMTAGEEEAPTAAQAGENEPPPPAASEGPTVEYKDPAPGTDTGAPRSPSDVPEPAVGEPPTGPRSPGGGETDVPTMDDEVTQVRDQAAPVDDEVTQVRDQAAPVDDEVTLVDDGPPTERRPGAEEPEEIGLPEGSSMEADTPEGTREMYENSLRDDPYREVALYENTKTGDVRAVQGDENGVPIDHDVWKESFPGNAEDWQLQAHSHPVNPNTGVTPFPERLPSSTGGDFSVIEAESQAAGGQARTSTIDVTTENGADQTHFTFDPNDPRPYKIDYPDPVTGERSQVDFASKEAYEEWYSDTFPGRQAQIDAPVDGGVAAPGGSTRGGGAASQPSETQELPADVVQRGHDILDIFDEAQGNTPREAHEEDVLAQDEVSNTAKPGGAAQPTQFQVGNFAHQYGADVGLIAPNELPPGGIPERTIPLEGGDLRPDMTYPDQGKVVEIKPNTQADKAQAEADMYGKFLDQEQPLGGGQKWQGSGATYDPVAAKQYMEKIGYLESSSAADNPAHNAADFERLKAQLAQEEIEGAPATGSALKSDAEHRAASFVTDTAGEGQHTTIVGGDQVPRNLTQVEGEMNGRSGIFEWIVDEKGNLTHQRFIPGGVRTGFPNQVPSRLATSASGAESAGSSSGSAGGLPRGPARPAPVPPPDVLPPTPTATGGVDEAAAATGSSTAGGAGAGNAAARVVSVGRGPGPTAAQSPARATHAAGGDARSGSTGVPAEPLVASAPTRAATVGPAAAAGAQAGARDAEANKTPGVEPVNPNYANPPGTPQQLKKLQDEISQTLAQRARAEQDKVKMDAQVQQHQANQGPAQQAIQGSQQALTATQAHQQDVAQRDTANKQQQAKQQEGQTTVGGYADKAAGLAMLQGPLTAFRGFTSLASHLPGDAGAAMSKMNSDGQKVQDAFDQMGVKMAEQATGLPLRQQQLQADNQSIQASGQQGSAAAADIQKAHEGAQAFRQANQTKLQQAQAGKEQASQAETRLDNRVQTEQQQETTLAEQLQSWATQHKAARVKAVEETKERLQAQGKVVTGAKAE
jgi:hypothetical protein